MPEDTFDKLEITFTEHTGAPGTDSDPHNPLARALSRLLKTGKPFGWIHACYFNPLPMAKGLRWLGIFMYSEGDRVIYFPGLREPQAQTFTSRGSEPIQRRQFQVDHLSLEADRRDWHLTGTGAKPHIGTYRSTDLGQGRVLWFGMSIASPDVLRLVHTRTLVDAQVPPTDARRRGDVIMRAREDVVFNEVLFNGEHRKLGQSKLRSLHHHCRAMRIPALPRRAPCNAIRVAIHQTRVGHTHGRSSPLTSRQFGATRRLGNHRGDTAGDSDRTRNVHVAVIRVQHEGYALSEASSPRRHCTPPVRARTRSHSRQHRRSRAPAFAVLVVVSGKCGGDVFRTCA
jgi:hypothetical protein